MISITYIEVWPNIAQTAPVVTSKNIDNDPTFFSAARFETPKTSLPYIPQ